jgi:Spy/CpxP family protein refolding chaperone
MKTLWRGGIAAGLALLLAVPVMGQTQRQRGFQGTGRGTGGFGALLQNEGVQKELKLEKEQADKVKAAVDKVQADHRDDFAKLRDLPADEQRTKRNELTRTVSAETLRAIEGLLNADQLKRLKQIELQQAGANAFSRDDVQTALKLTDEQKTKVKEIADKFSREMRELMGAGGRPTGRPPAGGRPNNPNQEKVTALRKQTNDDIQSVLTEDQKKAWKELTGAAFTVQTGRRPTDR